MAKAKKGDAVKVHCTAKLEDGRVFDSSEGREPFEFTIGQGRVIPGFEQAVVGMSPGDSKTEKVPADQGFGPYRDELILEVDRQQIPAHVELKVGNRLQFRQMNGQTTEALVADVSESKVRLDANHPLARSDLILDMQLLEIT
jgi:FKBP-type peptidyl-prolyl cis-trans isomerase 2